MLISIDHKYQSNLSSTTARWISIDRTHARPYRGHTRTSANRVINIRISWTWHFKCSARRLIQDTFFHMCMWVTADRASFHNLSLVSQSPFARFCRWGQADVTSSGESRTAPLLLSLFLDSKVTRSFGSRLISSDCPRAAVCSPSSALLSQDTKGDLLPLISKGPGCASATEQNNYPQPLPICPTVSNSTCSAKANTPQRLHKFAVRFSTQVPAGPFSALLLLLTSNVIVER